MKEKRYKFIGQDGSLGLKKGQYYALKIKRNIFSKKILVYIFNNKYVITCPYSSIKTFKENWECKEEK